MKINTLIQSFLGPLYIGLNDQGAVYYMGFNFAHDKNFTFTPFVDLPQKTQSKIHLLCRFVAHPETTDISSVNFDIQGPDIEKDVWEVLQSIPVGQIRSYSDVAKQVGLHHRAIAKICSRNNLAVFIPCHRVIMKSGQLGGYRWGTNLKRTILSYEGVCL